MFLLLCLICTFSRACERGFIFCLEFSPNSYPLVSSPFVAFRFFFFWEVLCWGIGRKNQLSPLFFSIVNACVSQNFLGLPLPILELFLPFCFSESWIPCLACENCKRATKSMNVFFLSAILPGGLRVILRFCSWCRFSELSSRKYAQRKNESKIDERGKNVKNPCARQLWATNSNCLRLLPCSFTKRYSEKGVGAMVIVVGEIFHAQQRNTVKRAIGISYLRRASLYTFLILSSFLIP